LKKIVYIWKGPYPFEIRIQKICESLINNGYEVTILCLWNYENNSEEIINKIKIIRNGYNDNLKKYIPIPYNPFWKKFLKDKITQIKPDLIINREFFLMTEVSPITRKLNIPIIIDMAENYAAAVVNFKKYTKTPFRRFLINNLKLIHKLEKHAVNNSNGVITVCKENQDRIIQKYNYNENNLSIVHNTPISSWFNEEPIFNNSPLIFNYMGYISKERNLENFILGFDLYCQDSSINYKLQIYGSGTELDNLKTITTKLKNKDNIQFFGNYNHQDLCKFINQGDIGILPYINDEFINTTISNKLFDYFAMGKPVLCSDVIPMKRILKEYNCGIYHDCSTPEMCKNAISKIIENYSKKMSDNALKAFKEKYNWSVDEEVLLNFIQKYN